MTERTEQTATGTASAAAPQSEADAAASLRQNVLVAPVAEALAEADAAAAAHPGSAELRMLRGLARERAGRRDLALADLRAAVDLAEAMQGGRRTTVLRGCLQNLGSVLVDAGKPKAALTRLIAAAELGDPKHSLLAGVGRAYAHTGDRENARIWGQKALEARDVLHPLGNAAPVAAARPKPFDPRAKARNVIAYCLFGDNRYYFDGAIANARIAMAAFSDFTPRFYCAPDTPKSVIAELAALGAQVKTVSGARSQWDGLFWRFWAFDDPEVDVVLIRDVDSPLTPRERGAIEDWLHGSEKPFHVMRDHVLHCEPMMAGLWGGFTGLLPKLAPLTRYFVAKKSFRYADQDFLRQAVWPRIRHATLAHDGAFALGDTRPFPEAGGRVYGSVHVGWAWPRPDRLSRAAI